MNNKVYNQALDIAGDYLGPAAERFINRQISFHLNKDPHELTKSDIPQLAQWVKVSIAILTEDHNLVDEFTSRIMGLSRGKTT